MAAAGAFRRAPCRLPLLPCLFQLSAVALLLLGLCSAGGNGAAGSYPFSNEHHADHDHHHHDHDHGPGSCGHHHHHGHGHGHGHHEHHRERKLPEELAEEEDLALEKFGDDEHFSDHFHVHHRHHHRGSHGDGADLRMFTGGLWLHAMGCSLLVSMASLICLIILPLFFLKGKPSKLVVDSMAVFGAGAMLGDAFLHQLPHIFGGEHSHTHDHHMGDIHDHTHEHTHSHSLEDLSVGLSVLAGILLFLIVEKIVRYIEDVSGKDGHTLGHGHHHHKSLNKKDDDTSSSHLNSDITLKDSKNTSGTEPSYPVSDENLKVGEDSSQETPVRKRRATASKIGDSKNVTATNGSVKEKASSTEISPSSKSSLVFGYLNLFSDGVVRLCHILISCIYFALSFLETLKNSFELSSNVDSWCMKAFLLPMQHNFTDGMALGSAFLLYGSVGGWSRTLFLLAHELPQEVGDFGILVRSGFTVFKALFFNFLSALVALAGTALALLLGKDPGHSSLIEGFTAGGFIYIAVAGVLPEMNNGSTSIKSSVIQLASFVLGMAVALCISLVE